jgi:hypothetical protein
MMYRGNILENVYSIDIPTDSKELAILISTYATDWAEVLAFFSRLAVSRKIVIKSLEVEMEIKNLLGADNGF